MQPRDDVPVRHVDTLRLGPVEVYRQSAADAAWSLAGGLVGGVATAAFLVNRFFRTRKTKKEKEER